MAGEKLYAVATGRFVRGDLFTGNDKNYHGQPRLDKAGQPMTSFFMTLAVRKDDATANELWQIIQAVKERDFPGGQYNLPAFKSKLYDGDQPHKDKMERLVPWPEWGQGCWLLNLEQVNQPIHVVDQNNRQIVDRNLIKTGDYVAVRVGVKGNDVIGDNAGLYLDPSIVKLVGYGEAIITRISADDAFGTQPMALPPGASATPIADAGGMPATGAVGAPVAGAVQAGAVGQPANPAPVAQPFVAPPGAVGQPVANPTAPVGAPIAPATGTLPAGAPVSPGMTPLAIASPSNAAPGTYPPNPAILTPQ